MNSPVSSAMTDGSAALPTSSLPPEKVAKLAQAAKDFEAMALGQLLAPSQIGAQPVVVEHQRGNRDQRDEGDIALAFGQDHVLLLAAIPAEDGGAGFALPNLKLMA